MLGKKRAGDVPAFLLPHLDPELLRSRDDPLINPARASRELVIRDCQLS
jgi:hypothetical protein